MAVFTSFSDVRHEHHARFPIQILDPDPVDLSFMARAENDSKLGFLSLLERTRPNGRYAANKRTRARVSIGDQNNRFSLKAWRRRPMAKVSGLLVAPCPLLSW